MRAENGPNKNICLIEKIENAFISILADLELLDATTPKQARLKSTINQDVATITRENGRLHNLRRAFE